MRKTDHTRKKARNKGVSDLAVRLWLARTHPDNWPMQEVHTLDDIVADRSVSLHKQSESSHANDR